MERTTSQKRPWLAALLGALATGFGHLYLRRWRRAVGWFAVLFAVSYLFVDPAAIDALAAGEPVDPLSVAPTLLVGGASVVDAYVLARAQNALARTTGTAEAGAREATEETKHATGETTDSCPNCGKEVDPELDFCHWCTADLPGGAEADFGGDGIEDADIEGSER
ncbi:zinc ribbon domain-containing protein [Halorubrum amylolyticum]|uniref:zinc ribbon domain-containing protein n=1 Tax=Halorubrum amylolyticum TaxID=2508724 RepID=UPI001008F837|nr:zinc ribbon domain-containing protein [Halorubrum amylolyticum]